MKYGKIRNEAWLYEEREGDRTHACPCGHVAQEELLTMREIQKMGVPAWLYDEVELSPRGGWFALFGSRFEKGTRFPLERRQVLKVMKEVNDD